jgi:hypothetical protein
MFPFAILQKVQHELLTQYENQLLEKEHSGCHSLLRDDKVEDLSRMYRLFCRIPKGLEPVAGVFRQVTGNPDPSRMISISVLFSVYKTRDSRNKFFVSRC